MIDRLSLNELELNIVAEIRSLFPSKNRTSNPVAASLNTQWEQENCTGGYPSSAPVPFCIFLAFLSVEVRHAVPRLMEAQQEFTIIVSHRPES